MVNQKRLNTINENENEKFMKLMGMPLSKMFVHGDTQSTPCEIPSTNGNSLIPRVMVTNIMVYAITLDIRMDSSSQRHRANNIQHGGTQVANNNSVVDDLKRVRSAIRDQNKGMLETLLNHQLNLIECTDEEGLTPLSFAAYNGICEMVSFIIRKYPKSINKRNKDGSYPIHKACLGGHVEIINMLYTKNSKSLFALDRQGKTVLHLAAQKRGNMLKHVVSYLLNLPEGRELMNKKDENRSKPLDLAVNYRNGEVEEILRSMHPQ